MDVKDQCRQDYELTGLTLKEVAEKHDVKLGTLKSWKSRDATRGNPWTKKVATLDKKVATKSHQVAWTHEQLEHEYVTTNLSLKKIAEKSDYNVRRIEEISSEKSWVVKRAEFRKKTYKKAIEKTSDNLAEDIVAYRKKHLEVSDLLLDAIKGALTENPEELKSQVVKLKQGFGQGEYTENLEVRELEVINEKKVATLTRAVSDLQKMQRQTLGVLDEFQKKRIDIEKVKTQGEPISQDKEAIDNWIKATQPSKEDLSDLFGDD